MFRKILAVSLAIGLLSSCGGGSDESESTVNGVTDSEIVIGSFADLSGPAALLGLDASMVHDSASTK